MSETAKEKTSSHDPQMLGSLLVAVVIVIVTIAVVSSRLGASPELREELREEEEEARAERQEAEEERREGSSRQGADS